MPADDDFFLNEPGLNRGDRAFRKLCRAMACMKECWRTCDLKRCRRSRQCRGNAQVCVRRDTRLRGLSDEEHRLAMRDFKQFLAQQMAARGATETVAPSPPAKAATKRRRDSAPGSR